MKYKGPMLVVKDIEKTKEFYTKILNLRVIADFGVNITFTGGLSAQTEASWQEFTGCKEDFFTYQGNDAEFYFEEEDFDSFIQRIENEDIKKIGDVMSMPYGQKVLRFYDPDKHIIEVGEDLTVMVKRMSSDGMSVEAIAEKTFLKNKMVERMLKK